MNKFYITILTHYLLYSSASVLYEELVLIAHVLFVPQTYIELESYTAIISPAGLAVVPALYALVRIKLNPFICSVKCIQNFSRTNCLIFCIQIYLITSKKITHYCNYIHYFANLSVII